MANFILTNSIKKFEKGIGILTLAFALDTTFNRYTYEEIHTLESESQAILSTFRIEKRF